MDDPIFQTDDFTVWLWNPRFHGDETASVRKRCAWGGHPHTYCHHNGEATYSVEGIFGYPETRRYFAVCTAHLGCFIRNCLAVRHPELQHA